MSGFLSFAIRRGSQVDVFATSSGSLQHLYDPNLYGGQAAALAAFTDRARMSPDEFNGPVPFAPWNYGLVVLDFDNKRQWDLQVARDMRDLSGSFDYSWMHFQAWIDAGWLGSGLVNPLTGEVVHKFPAAGVGDWYEDVRAEHFRCSRAAADDAFPDAETLDTWPVVRISPPGWQISSFELEEKGEFLVKLVDDGYHFSPSDLCAWRDWHPGA